MSAEDDVLVVAEVVGGHIAVTGHYQFDDATGALGTVAGRSSARIHRLISGWAFRGCAGRAGVESRIRAWGGR
ncbi:hypothetical protein ACFU9X_30950, partial [Streptomyces atratus]|uniref:hypothetical protein n=1 Tax=Streptomyces atratus TaxID=1893 RepID=UPI0036C4072F